jgi:hypothetical protein
MRLAKEIPFWTEVFIALHRVVTLHPDCDIGHDLRLRVSLAHVMLGRAFCHHSVNNPYRPGQRSMPLNPLKVRAERAAGRVCHGRFSTHLCIDRFAQVG